MMHPEFAARDAALRAECDRRGWGLWWVRQEATYQEQYNLWWKYVNNQGNLAVAPWAIGPVTPFGWRQIGSLHQVQQDGFSHAADYGISGCTWPQFHGVAWDVGIRFMVPGERWHGSWWDSAGIYPVYSPPLVLPAPTPIVKVDEDMAKLVKCDDGDIAVWLTDGVSRSWVRDGDAYVSLRDAGVAQAALDGSPLYLNRAAISSLVLAGPAPIYPADYVGPRTTT